MEDNQMKIPFVFWYRMCACMQVPTLIGMPKWIIDYMSKCFESMTEEVEC